MFEVHQHTNIEPFPCIQMPPCRFSPLFLHPPRKRQQTQMFPRWSSALSLLLYCFISHLTGRPNSSISRHPDLADGGGGGGGGGTEGGGGSVTQCQLLLHPTKITQGGNGATHQKEQSSPASPTFTRGQLSSGDLVAGWDTHTDRQRGRTAGSWQQMNAYNKYGEGVDWEIEG